MRTSARTIVFLVAYSTWAQLFTSAQQVPGNRTSASDQPQGVRPDASKKAPLEPRMSNFVRDIVERLHALDDDIGKLVYNSTSMYAANDGPLGDQVESANDMAGGQKFTEVLNDLDALQDEISRMIANTTRNRQYNILVRLRPLNTLLYRIRHNLHLMRNSLVAINTVSALERLGNNVLDSTLTAFMRPDANLNEEIGDIGNYDINLDKPEEIKTESPPIAASNSVTTSQPATIRSVLTTVPTSTTVLNSISNKPSTSVKPTNRSATTSITKSQPKITPTTAISTTSTTTSKPVSSAALIQLTNSTTEKPDNSTSRRTTRRPNNRNRANHRRSTTTTTLTPMNTGARVE